ncbi:uncharacterized protein LOC143020506 [Oratosquilla oratoria]|uniref:uncharacterized protein LOC143020506 n=1 Tax=Oratosquilla oratoria TaxID=337810 RepID=UPI003F776B50
MILLRLLERSLHFLRRLLWLAIFAAGSYFTAINGFEIYQDYFGYPVVSSVTTLPGTSAIFPAVTLCNQNRVQCSSLIRSAFRAVPGVPSRLLRLSGCLNARRVCPLVWKELVEVEAVDPTGLYNTSRCFTKCDLMNDWRESLFQEDAPFEDQQMAEYLLGLSDCSLRPLTRRQSLRRTKDLIELEGDEVLEVGQEHEEKEIVMLGEQVTGGQLEAEVQEELEEEQKMQFASEENGDVQSNFAGEKRAFLLHSSNSLQPSVSKTAVRRFYSSQLPSHSHEDVPVTPGDAE